MYILYMYRNLYILYIYFMVLFFDLIKNVNQCQCCLCI